MYNIKLILTFIICSGLSLAGKAQAHHDTTMAEYESLLMKKGKLMILAKSNNSRDSMVLIIKDILTAALSKESSYKYPFDSLQFLSHVYSDDGAVRVYTWSVPQIDNSNFKYYGFIQLYKKQGLFSFLHKPVPYTIELFDETPNIPDPENTAKLTSSKWYGAYYYRVLSNTYHGKTYYTLLGWKGNNTLTTQKVIDNFVVSGNKVQFGLPIFKKEKMLKYRMVFEFSYRVSMLLHYEPDALVMENKPLPYKKGKKHVERKTKRERLIVFDHLAPINPMYEGQFAFYGPDMSYDAMKFEKGRWVYQPAIDIRNETKKVNASPPSVNPKWRGRILGKY